MALQDILKRILDQAQSTARTMQEETDARRKQMARESEFLEKEELAKLKGKAEKVTATIEQKMCSMAKRENAKNILRAKQNVIQTALTQFLDMLEKADDKTYGQILTRLFESLPVSSGRVYAPPKRLEITTHFAPPGFDVVAHKDITGGFIVRDGDAEIDASLRNLVFSEYKDQLTLYFAEQLRLA